MAKKVVNVNGTDIITCEEIKALRGTSKLIKEYQKLMELKKSIEERTLEIKAEVTALMETNNVSVMKAGGYKVALVEQKARVTFDKDRFQEEEPELYAKYVKKPDKEFTYQFRVSALTGTPAKAKGTTALVEAIREALTVTDETVAG